MRARVSEVLTRISVGPQRNLWKACSVAGTEPQWLSGRWTTLMLIYGLIAGPRCRRIRPGADLRGTSVSRASLDRGRCPTTALTSGAPRRVTYSCCSLPGTFDDCEAVHLLPGGQWDRRRFRPNLLVHDAAGTRDELAWVRVGWRLTIGTVELAVTEPTSAAG